MAGFMYDLSVISSESLRDAWTTAFVNRKNGSRKETHIVLQCKT